MGATQKPLESHANLLKPQALLFLGGLQRGHAATRFLEGFLEGFLKEVLLRRRLVRVSAGADVLRRVLRRGVS